MLVSFWRLRKRINKWPSSFVCSFQICSMHSYDAHMWHWHQDFMIPPSQVEFVSNNHIMLGIHCNLCSHCLNHWHGVDFDKTEWIVLGPCHNFLFCPNAQITKYLEQLKASKIGRTCNFCLTLGKKWICPNRLFFPNFVSSLFCILNAQIHWFPPNLNHGMHWSPAWRKSSASRPWFLIMIC